MTDVDVDLYCVTEHRKLRVRIMSPGYLPEANCQFPRAIRREGVHYRVKSSDICLVTQRSKWFYSVRRGAHIEILPGRPDRSGLPDLGGATVPVHLKVYEDKDTNECAVCLENPKTIVFDPCGHYYVCNVCATRLSQCPICRTSIRGRIDKSLVLGDD